MKTSDRWLMIAVSGSLTVLLPGEMPVTAAPPGQIKEVKVDITPSGKACNHHLARDAARLKKSQDALGWRIKNTCRLDQDVLLCVYRNDRLYNPFHSCKPDPATRDVGKIFKVASKATVNLDCLAQDTGSYRKLILVGDEIPQGGCPAAIPPSVEPKAHRIGIDILP